MSWERGVVLLPKSGSRGHGSNGPVTLAQTVRFDDVVCIDEAIAADRLNAIRGMLTATP